MYRLERECLCGCQKRKALKATEMPSGPVSWHHERGWVGSPGRASDRPCADVSSITEDIETIVDRYLAATRLTVNELRGRLGELEAWRQRPWWRRFLGVE